MKSDQQEVSRSLNTFFLRLMLLRHWRVEHVADAVGSTHESFVLELIDRYDGISASEISRFLGVAQSSIAGFTKQAADIGLIQKEEATSLKKALHLTPAGKGRLECLRRASSLHVIDQMIEDMPEEVVTQLKGCLNSLEEAQKAQFGALKVEPIPVLFS